MSISDERLAELIGLGCDGIARHEACALATEVQGFRAAAKVRAIREGDGEVCATEGCGNAATERFESGGVGSIHCPSCIANIAALAASPIPATGGEKRQPGLDMQGQLSGTARSYEDMLP